MPILLIYTTHPDEATALKISEQLLEEKLIACFNLFPVKSGYWWQNKICRDDETTALLKTVPEKWAAVCERIRSLHPYEIPCIVKMEVEAETAYEEWILQILNTEC